MKFDHFLAFIMVAGALLCSQVFGGERIKDLAYIRGVRSNQLIGYGLVVGLNGTGDSKAVQATTKAASNMLTIMGMRVGEGDIPTKNVASVIVTADLHPFARNGDFVDLRISSLGDAKSLAGGTLLMTPLKAGDGEIYAYGQGTLVFGRDAKNQASALTVSNIPGGGKVEKEFFALFAQEGRVVFSLKNPDFTNASRISDTVNLQFRGFYAEALDASGVEIQIPPSYKDKVVEFVSLVEHLEIEVDSKARVVLNEKTGTIVMGADVVIKPVSISHSGITIKVKPTVGKDEKGSTTVGDFINSLNALGLKPEDHISIFQSLKASGALSADLKII